VSASARGPRGQDAFGREGRQLVTIDIGIGLGMLHPSAFDAAAEAADRAGFESIWMPEHLVFPIEMAGSPHPGDDHPPVPPETPLFDVFAYLAYLAGRTERVRLGTWVYLLGLRHPFVSARAIATLDHVSGGRALVGVGAGWLRQEWQAAGLDPRTRGRRLDEALEVCRRLWTEEVVSFDGRFHAFEPVRFEPKPVQRPHPPILAGGESTAALDRAAGSCEGWIGVSHSPDSAAERVAELRRRLEAKGRDPDAFEYVVGGNVAGPADVEAYARAGLTRIIVSPWRRSREAVDGIAALAETLERSAVPLRREA
jgi:probable F420-dependent oxidoreductase